MNKRGVTLIEILIAAAITLVLLAVVGRGLVSGSDTVWLISSQGELLEDSRYVSQMMADSVSRAVYVYRPGIQLTLQTDAAHTYSVTNSATGTNQWTIGTHPILAYIEAPSKTSATTNCDAAHPEVCLHFVAYYPVLRSVVTASATGPDHPGEDPSNNDKWVLFEYRERLPLKSLSTSNAPPKTFSGSRGNILMDYLSPSTLVINTISCRNQTGAAETCSTLQTSPQYLASVQSGEVRFQTKVQRRKEYKVPELSFVIAPRNLYAE